MSDVLLARPEPESVPPSVDPIEWAKRCAAHAYHAPIPRYLEKHHVIPRAWQAYWTPPELTQSSHPTLWAPETVLLCRSGHGNVHWLLEAMMYHYQGSIHDAFEAATADLTSVGRQEHIIARSAMERYEAAGGDLSLLVSAGLYGGMYGGNAE